MSMSFRVMYKLPSMRQSVVVDHIMDDLKDLMKFLARDGITKETVEYLYVHYTPSGSNETMELVCVDNGKRVANPANTKLAEVIPLDEVRHLKKAVEAKTKPRINLKDLPDMGLVMLGRHSAMRGDYNVAVS